MGIAMLLLAILAVTACIAQTIPDSPMKGDVEAALGAICKPNDIKRSKAGDLTGCRVCPEGSADSLSAYTGGWELNVATPGHFTSEDSDELLIGIAGCEPHANNFGGSILFARKDGKVRLVKYEPGLITNRCHKFSHADGRGYLVCQEGWTGQGETFDNVVVVSFTPFGKPASANLIRTEDTTMSCSPGMSTMVQKSAITGIQFTPQDSAQITGLTITASLGHIPCSQVGKKAMSPRWAATLKSYAIEFLFDGKQFRVAPTSRAALQRFAQEWGLVRQQMQRPAPRDEKRAVAVVQAQVS
jgi:hypothetical protein